MLNISDLTYRKLEVETDGFIKKYDIKELPSLLIFKSGKMIGKINGYYSIEDTEKFIKEIREII